MLMDRVVAGRLPLEPAAGFLWQRSATGGRTDMVKWPKILGLAVLSCGMPMTSLALEVRAATSAPLDILPSDRPGEDANTVDPGSRKSISGPNQDGGRPPGN